MKNDRATNVIVMAGTKWQIPLIRKLKEKGCRVIDFNPLPDSPAFKYADEYRVVDILNYEACLKYARELKPDAIMSEECDIATVPVARLSEGMGLKSIGTEMAQLYTNKYLMRCFGHEHHFDMPAFFKCDSADKALEIYRNQKAKMIMKPLDGNSSRGVFTINNQNDIIEHFEDCIKFSRTEKSVLMEEYIDGTEFTVDGIKTEKGHISLACSEKRHYEHNENIACSLFFSNRNDKYDYDKLRRINDAFVNLTNLPFGLTHSEYKYKDGKYYMIEIGARGGGNLISAVIVPLISGVDNYEYLINKTLNKECDENIYADPRLSERCVLLQFFDTKGKEAKIRRIFGRDYLKKCKNIVDYYINYNEGDIVEPAADDSKRLGYYIAYGENEKELDQVITETNSSFGIDFEELE